MSHIDDAYASNYVDRALLRESFTQRSPRAYHHKHMSYEYTPFSKHMIASS